MDTSDYNLVESNKVFVIWNWTWLVAVDIESSESEDNVSESDGGHSVMENTDDNEDDPDDDSIPAITHAVVFKCIGCNKEKRYQELLALAKKKSARDDVNIPVKLQPEPNNPIDSKAIAFMCKVENDWERIGYVVQEALDDVHEAINTNKILGVSFQWIKFIVYFKTPGWYAGIKITRSGEWSNAVLRSQANAHLV